MKYADIVDVLRNAQKNNTREWYMQEKEIFREVYRTLNDLYFEVGNKLREKAAIDMVPGKSISRPYNDQRFGSKPYLRENQWVTFQSDESPSPAFFIEFSPYGIRNGMGYYSATPAQMRNMRMIIDSDPQGFTKLIKKVQTDKEIQIVGEPYKKRFATNYEGVLEEIYNYRSIYFQKIISSDHWESLEEISNETFFELAPIYKVLTKKL